LGLGRANCGPIVEKKAYKAGAARTRKIPAGPALELPPPAGGKAEDRPRKGFHAGPSKFDAV